MHQRRTFAFRAVRTARLPAQHALLHGGFVQHGEQHARPGIHRQHAARLVQRLGPAVQLLQARARGKRPAGRLHGVKRLFHLRIGVCGQHPCIQQKVTVAQRVVLHCAGGQQHLTVPGIDSVFTIAGAAARGPVLQHIQAQIFAVGAQHVRFGARRIDRPGIYQAQARAHHLAGAAFHRQLAQAAVRLLLRQRQRQKARGVRLIGALVSIVRLQPVHKRHAQRLGQHARGPHLVQIRGHQHLPVIAHIHFAVQRLLRAAGLPAALGQRTHKVKVIPFGAQRARGLCARMRRGEQADVRQAQGQHGQRADGQRQHPCGKHRARRPAVHGCAQARKARVRVFHASCASFASFSVNDTRVPTPAWLSMRSCAPCSAAIFWHRARPMPLPPALRARDLSTI